MKLLKPKQNLYFFKTTSLRISHIISPSFLVGLTLSIITVFGFGFNIAAASSVTFTTTEDFNNNTVVGPDLIPGTGDDDTTGPATTLSDSRIGNFDGPFPSAEFSQVYLNGDFFVIAKHNDGTLWAWGRNSSGQLGVGDFVQKNSPTKISTDTDWDTVTPYGDYVVATKTNGTVWAWGENSDGQLGVGDTTDRNTPTQVGVDTDWDTVLTDFNHTVAKKNNGTLWAWGYNFYGSLGVGDTTNRTSPTQIGTDTDWQNLQIKSYSAFATKTNGTVWSWGANFNGLLGVGDTTHRSVPTQMGTDTDWDVFYTNLTSMFATKTDGTLWAWGANSSGQLGVGDTTQRESPTQVNTDTDWNSFASGSSYTLATKDNGTLWAWGRNNSGQLGVGDTTNRTSPTQVGTDTNWDNIYTNLAVSFTFVTKTNDTLWSMGANSSGQLGVGDTSPRSSPTQVGVETVWDRIYVNNGASVVGLRTDGTLYAWGDNSSGKLGVGLSGNRTSPTATYSETSGGWADVYMGTFTFYIARKADGKLYSTGGSTGATNGALGVGSTVTRTRLLKIDYTTYTAGDLIDQGVATLKTKEFASAEAGQWYVSAGRRPDGTLWAAGNGYLGIGSSNLDRWKTIFTKINNDTDWASYSVGYDHTLALKTDGTLWAWGNNSTAQIGDGTYTARNTPVQIGTDTDWTKVSAGDITSFAMKSNGTIWSWGSDTEGNLGQGTYYVEKTSPTQIGTDTDWVDIVAGDYHVLAKKSNGTLWTWGANWNYQLGLGDTTYRNVPTQIGSDTDWDELYASYWGSFVIKTNGTLWVWGGNGTYQLGLGDTTERQVPTQLGTDTDWDYIGPGYSNTAALKTDGSLWAWGQGSRGALGFGNFTDVTTPAQVGTETDWQTVTAGDGYTLAMKSSGVVWSTGYNYNGELALGTGTRSQINQFAEVNTSPYYVLGTVSGLKVNASSSTSWNSITWNSNALPVGTEIRFRVRTSDDDISYSAWSSYFTQDADNSTTGTADLSSITDSQYLEMELSLTTSDETVTPVLLDFTLDYGAGGGGTPPTVTSQAASGIGETSATLNGTITDIGSANPTTRGFEYGLTNAYGTTSSEAGSFSTGAYTASLSSLVCNTLYYFRAFATNTAGTGNGAETTFTTSACPSSGSSGTIIKPPAEDPPVISPPPTTPPDVPVSPPTDTTPDSPIVSPPSTGDDSGPIDDTTVGDSGDSSDTETPISDVPTTPTTPQETKLETETSTITNIVKALQRQLNNIARYTFETFGTFFALIPLNQSSSWNFAQLALLILIATSWDIFLRDNWHRLLSFLGWYKKKRFWGTVYDSKTKQPLDPVVVELLDAQTSQVVETAITDLAGRYGFLAKAGEFFLRASKTHYRFPSQDVPGHSDEIYGNLYHGEKLVLLERSSLVTPNIPMDQVQYDWNQEEKERMKPNRLRFWYWMRSVMNVIFAFGFIFSIYNIIFYGGWWNWLVFIFYVVVLIIKILIIEKRLWGLITKDGRPFSGAFLQLAEPRSGVVMGKSLSAEDGKFFLKAPQSGQYMLTVKSQVEGEVLVQGLVKVGKESVYNHDILL